MSVSQSPGSVRVGQSAGVASSPAQREAPPTSAAPKSSSSASGSASTPVAANGNGAASAAGAASMTPAKLYPAMVDLMKNKVLHYFQQCQTSATPSKDHTILYDLMARLYMEIERVYPLPSSNSASQSGPSLGPLPSIPANSAAAPAPAAAPKEAAKDANAGLAGGAVSAIEMRRSSLTRLQSAPTPSTRSSITAASAASPSASGSRPSAAADSNPFVLTPAHFKKYNWQDEQCRVAYENALLLSQLLTEGEPDESTHLSDIVMETVGSLREVTIKVSKRLMTAEEKDEKIIRELFSAQEAAQAILTHHYKLLNHILSPGAAFKLPAPPVTAMTNDDGTRRQHPLFYNQPHVLKSVKLRDADREKKSEADSKAESDPGEKKP